MLSAEIDATKKEWNNFEYETKVHEEILLMKRLKFKFKKNFFRMK